MDAQTLEETPVLRRFAFEPIEVTVHKCPERDRHDDHDCLITITVKDDEGVPDKMLTLCSCHTRSVARMLEKAADAAESIEEGTEV
jgi:hypothetical protein